MRYLLVAADNSSKLPIDLPDELVVSKPKSKKRQTKNGSLTKEPKKKPRQGAIPLTK